ncbi:MAG: hypothetical protein IJU24_08015 [Bacteroidaceae bacterium]|nr:hypothetical protein [Bacteroidaceae bacterium]
MKKLLLLFISMLISNILPAQEKVDSISEFELIDVVLTYPTMSDAEVDNFSKRGNGLIINPTLIINNMVIRDTVMINCFRNQFQTLLRNKIIVKEKLMKAEDAYKKGLTDISKDGVILIKTKNKYFLDLNQ